jgi:hypothetical protein
VIEPTIWHTKSDSKIDRNWLEGALDGTAMPRLVWRRTSLAPEHQYAQG